MNGQGILEMAWRARWLGAALLLHIAVIGPLLLLEPGRHAPLVPLDVFEIEIIEIAAAVPEPEEPAETEVPEPPRPTPKPEPPQQPAIREPSAEPKISVPIVRDAPPAAQSVVIRPAPPRSIVSSPPSQTAERPGGGAVGGAEQLALRSIFCRDMTDWQREDAGCAALEETQKQYAPLYEATPLPDYERIQQKQMAALSATIGETYVEGFLKRNSGVPVSFGEVGSDSIYQTNNPSGVDNSIFVPRRPPGQGALDRIDRGQRPDWEDEIRRAHGTD